MKTMKTMKTTEQFILEAKEIHGDRYDYSKVVYTGKDNKIIIYCKNHGEFEQRPNSHLRGMNCKKCSVLEGSSKQTSNLEEFIKKAKEMHGDRYDYSKVEYINAKHKIIIICKIHGEFEQEPHSHLTGCGCKKCGVILRGENRRYTNEEFIQKIKEIHGDTYDYSKVQYTGIYNKIIIICKKHGEIKQNANTHLRGNGCKRCADILRGENLKYTNEEFIEKIKEVHGDTYDYSKVQYTGYKNKIIIICKKHGEFEQMAGGHICGYGCNLCGNEKIGNSLRHTNNDFIRRAFEKHGDTYDYSNSVYNGIDNLITIICKKHGEFEQSPYLHIKGCGCPFCTNKSEWKLYDKMKSIYTTFLSQFRQEWCKNKKPLPYDFCIPEYKIIIELDGVQHFQQVSNWSSPEEQFENDKFKEECANNNGYSVIRLLQEDVLYDTYDWVKELCDAIEQIKSSNEITNIYLSKNDEYDNF